MINFLKKIVKTNAHGFTLLEINLVLLIFGIALTSLLGLFPVGLRQASLATGDSIQSTFADQVLNTLHAEASLLTDWNDWKNEDNFIDALLADAKIDGRKIKESDTIDGYLGVENSTIQYRLEIEPVIEPVDFENRLYRANIQVLDRAQGSVTNSPTYSTDFMFMGKIEGL